MTTELQPERAAQQRIDDFASRIATIRRSLHEVVVGQEGVVVQILLCVLTGSHALVVGVPGLAKTLIVKALASAFHWKFARIQFTPDLMPADVTGYELLGRDEASASPKNASTAASTTAAFFPWWAPCKGTITSS